MSLVKKRNVETVWGYFIKSAKVWSIKEETITGDVMRHYFKKTISLFISKRNDNLSTLLHIPYVRRMASSRTGMTQYFSTIYFQICQIYQHIIL